VFQITIEQRSHSGATNGQKFAGRVRATRITFIDLSGSEMSGTDSGQRQEGACIKRSLLVLGKIISKLAGGASSHLPFRDSKLTRLLQPALTCDSNTSIICNISPRSANLRETVSTLQFASRACKIILAAPTTRQRQGNNALLLECRAEVARLSEVVKRQAAEIAAANLRMDANAQELARVSHESWNLRQRLGSMAGRNSTQSTSATPPTNVSKQRRQVTVGRVLRRINQSINQ
jgi:centromeric protein E